MTLLLLLFTACVAYAQVGVYRSNGVIKKEKKEYRELREREQREREARRLRDSIAREERKAGDAELANKRQERISKMEWTNSVLLNYAWTFVGGTSNLGITYSRCKLGGFYVSAMSGLEGHWHTDYVLKPVDNYGYYTDKYGHRKMVTNEKSHPRISFTAGGVARFGPIPMWAYAGVGYAYRGLNYRTIDGNWVRSYVGRYNLGNCADIEFGLIGNIKGVTLQVGFSLLVSESVETAAEMKFGIGYTF